MVDFGLAAFRFEPKESRRSSLFGNRSLVEHHIHPVDVGGIRQNVVHPPNIAEDVTTPACHMRITSGNIGKASKMPKAVAE